MKRRCIIPVTARAEAEAAKGGMTRAWYSLPDQRFSPLPASGGRPRNGARPTLWSWQTAVR